MALRKYHDEGIGRRIREIRNSIGLSQEEFGKAAGKYSQDTVAKWEAGQIPPALVLKKIAALAEPAASVDWLLDAGAELDEETIVKYATAPQAALLKKVLELARDQDAVALLVRQIDLAGEVIEARKRKRRHKP
jgi:transcriptional regulator with XRE-family HTH domain